MCGFLKSSNHLFGTVRLSTVRVTQISSLQCSDGGLNDDQVGAAPVGMFLIDRSGSGPSHDTWTCQPVFAKC